MFSPVLRHCVRVYLRSWDLVEQRAIVSRSSVGAVSAKHHAKRLEAQRRQDFGSLRGQSYVLSEPRRTQLREIISGHLAKAEAIKERLGGAS